MKAKNNQFEVSDTDSCDIKDVFQKQSYCFKEYDIDFKITNEIEEIIFKISGQFTFHFS
jgi:hypothetical protein